MQSSLNISLSDFELRELILRAKDWILINGVCMRSRQNFDENISEIAPFCLLPSCFPKSEFQRASEVQVLLNELMHKVAHNYEFLSSTLRSTIEKDEFTSKLFDIYHTVHTEGYAQRLSLGLIRSDYMLHSDEKNTVKQVEINMISTSFAGLAARISKYHRFILRELGHLDGSMKIPKNDSDIGFASGLMEAWKIYSKKEAAILFVLEDVVYNVFDQRALEFKIYELNPSIKVIRRTLTELTRVAQLGSSKELLVDKLEIAVVYYRTAYQLEAYPSDKEWKVRLLIERSRAIKCPSIQYQLAGTKKVQQQLAVPGILERFFSDQRKIKKITGIFVGLYSLDLDADGDNGAMRALQNPEKYVLKPQREGGGNNIYGNEIKMKLEAMDRTDRSAYILMDKIHPPHQKNYLIRAGKDFRLQDCVSELGIYGVILGDENEIKLNTQCGHILRTKPASADEGGIVIGAGSIDGPYLIE
ncbi:hypothetical protein QAD02_003944 [Eretmocerus hayati]|uniref:Uncharacterized protein n=1 Tax=Eretmocerus hayati TaxID=131215 RepID=A0ACC2NN47_9HYME|nr:hypothetical protein QAD02_003944 [Eretmocerus hayati]